MLVHSKIPRRCIQTLPRYILLINASPSRFSSTKSSKSQTFEDIGVNKWVSGALQKKFPHVKTPTPTQEEFIPAILKGRDVLIQDRTGTGK